MSIVEQLNRLYREIPGCLAVVFGDMQTKTVFRSFAKDNLCQEDHDRLLEMAALWLTPPAENSSDHPAGLNLPMQVSLQGRRSIRVFARLLPEASDVLCILAVAEAPLADLHRSIRAMVMADD
ncbi:hypothetical protein [Aliiruegeria lutimaris]|uniref:Roadblock/LC7 domain-containing protein n=1 Tax=Aliiruegeria lutimaris TaxID=571298 RepID=A0A1G8VXP1_9RHOB|nr:hypothetical protein [Aliiruegeria lutimaris]SDJ70607.1 hypothetical protein SAMN04488026_102266 [Aliiruegeria lutimaris]